MNNSKIAIDNVNLKDKEVDTTPYLRVREKELLQTVEAIQAVKASNYWKVLEKNVFGGLVESFDKTLRTTKDEKTFLFAQGARSIAEKFSDFNKLESIYQQELKSVRSQLKPDNKK